VSPTQVSVGGNYSCAEDAGKLVCWGYMGLEEVTVPDQF